ncbi:MAG: diguanylate cyclase [Granulosicoccus sp.]
MNDENNQLACLILTTDSDQKRRLTEALQQPSCVEHVDIVRDNAAFRQHLSERRYDLAVLAVEDIGDRLPACLLRYPDLRVLVLLPGKRRVDPGSKTHPLSAWLQQGANDVVNQGHDAAITHALSRLLDECILQARLRASEANSRYQNSLLQAVLDSHPHAVALSRQGEHWRSNAAFATLNNEANQTQQTARSCLEWMDGASQRTCNTLNTNANTSFIVKSRQGKRFELALSSIQLGNDEVRLLSVQPVSIAAQCKPDTDLDSVTGLPARTSVVQRFQKLLQSPRAAGRYTAMLVQLPDEDQLLSGSGANRTLQDLTLYRAADALQQHFKSDTLLGRTSRNALLLIRPTTPTETSRATANRVRQVLGSLGGLVDPPSNVRINTLTLASSALSAHEVMARLERC